MLGRYEGRDVCFPEKPRLQLDANATPCKREWAIHPNNHHRIAVVSANVRDGKVGDSLLYLLRGLGEIVDDILLYGNGPIFASELEKLEGLVSKASFREHGQGRFGSYKRGFNAACRLGLLPNDGARELLFIDDSQYGPLQPFELLFEVMKKRECDFWSYESSGAAQWRVHSSFMVFRHRVIQSGLLHEFFRGVEGESAGCTACDWLEGRLSESLLKERMIESSYIHHNIKEEIDKGFSFPLSGKIPFVIDSRLLTGESREECLEYLKQTNYQLYELCRRESLSKEYAFPNISAFRNSLSVRADRIGERSKNGDPINVLFLVNSPAMFAGKRLMDLMMNDSAFNPKAAAIPDFRWTNSMDERMESCHKWLLDTYPSERVLEARKDRYGRWPDLVSGSDIVCFPSPYGHLSAFCYNPRYALSKEFLPIMLNYGFYRSVYDRILMGMESYAYCWRVLLECESNLNEYSKYSVVKGKNAVLVGCTKLDALAECEKRKSSRKRVLVALHHSVDGGFNDTLGLSNFIRYFECFKGLPDRHPDIDFTYRPHPELFNALKRAQGWDDKDVTAYIIEMSSKRNVTWSEGGDYIQEFADSDACIQDCGSFLVEYFYTGKPCCYMLKDSSDIETKFAPLGIDCLNQCYLSYNTDDIEEFIKEVVLDGNDSKAESRAQLAKRIMVNYPHAAEVAINGIKRTLLGYRDND